MPAPRYWREMPQRYRYEAAKCKKCGKVCFPTRIVCPVCQGREFEKYVVNTHGTLDTYTVIRVAPSQFVDQAPYPIGIVNLGDDVRVLCQIADCEPVELKIGMKVRLEFRRIQKEGEGGILCYGYKAVPEF
jgi:uncharacterized OB-fold protein